MPICAAASHSSVHSCVPSRASRLLLPCRIGSKKQPHGRSCAPQATEQHKQAADTLEQQQEPQQQQQHTAQPALWCQGIPSGSFNREVQAVLPPVAWQPADLIKVVTYALPAAGLAVGINSQLRQWLLTSGVADTAAAGAVGAGAGGATSSSSAAAIEAGAASIQQLAHLHLAQEAVLALLLPAAVRFALGPRVTAAAASPYWVGQTLGTCLLLFPLVDPLLSSVWQPVAEAGLGPAPVNPLVGTLQQAGASGQTGALVEHCVASGLLGPFWEEVFWRGFFLTALTKVLPIPACVALSALNFAALHLSPANLLPLLVLGATCDGLYLRSGGNLLAPLLLHGLWNSSQVLQIALLHKDTFV